MLARELHRQTRRLARSVATTALRDNLRLTLPDGRTLGYAECGPPDGHPLLFFHGFPASRLEITGLADAATKASLRVIGPDRPGFGVSTPQLDRQIIDWPADVTALLAHMGLERVAVLGGSGGGPYALACAAAIPDSLSAVGVLAGAPPWTAGLQDMPRVSRWGKTAAVRYPRATSTILDSLVGLAWRTAQLDPVKRWIDSSLAAGAQAKGKPAVDADRLLRLMFEGFAQGSEATVHEARLLSSDWGFRFEDINHRAVKIWHGVDDARSPIRMVRWMAEQIPHCTLREYSTGHFDIHKVLDEVLADLMQDAL